MKLEIDGWEQDIKFCASHFIPKHNKCNRLHGHQYTISARIHGGQGRDGMVYDFVALKKVLRKIASELDHRVLLPGHSEQVKIESGEVVVKVSFDNKRYSFPREDVILLDIGVACAEELAKYVLLRLLKEKSFPKNIEKIEIGIEEEKGQRAWAQKTL